MIPAAPVINTYASRERPARRIGSLASGAGYLVPDQVRKFFHAGWKEHVPLTFLTDKHCSYKSGLQVTSQDTISFDENGKIIMTPKTLPAEGELNMTFEEWFQAWTRLLPLIQQYRPEEYELWVKHYLRILHHETRSEFWQLWLAYDVEVRRRSTCQDIDPQEMHSHIWNDLELRYLEKKVEARVEAKMELAMKKLNLSSPMRNSNSRHHPYSRRTNKTDANDSFPKDAQSYRCLLCGTRGHSPKACKATALCNGKPLHLPKPSTPNETRRDKEGRVYCFSWNGKKAQCDDDTCSREHACSLCGHQTHNAQSCLIVA